MQRLKNIFLTLTKQERISLIVAGVVAFVSFFIVAGIYVSRATTVVPARGGEYTEGVVGQPEYVNPVTASTETDLSLVKLIYSNIYDVADKVESSPDGRTWTVRLKENLHWQDGEKLTSDDVIFTVQSITSDDANSPLAQSWQGVAVSRGSELEVQFNLANPYAFFGDNLHNLYILPKHLFANTPPGNWHLSDYNLKPVGSGPYRFVSYEKSSDGVISAYHLEASPKYFGARPLIDRINFAFFPNTDELVKGFNSGEIDGFGGLQASVLASLARPYDLFPWRTPSYYAIFWNQSKNLALQDANVREALSAAIDRNALVTDALGGHGKPAYGPIPEDAPYYVPTEPSSTTSTDAAAMLDAAGWKAGSDGFRAKTIQKTSVPLAITLTVPDIDFLAATANDVQAAWQAIGVKVTIAKAPAQDLVDDAIKNRDYEALLFGNVLGPSSDLYAFWDSSRRFAPGLNLAIYQNKSVDTLIESARMNLDPEARAGQFADAQAKIVADAPAVFLYSPDYLFVTDKSVRGITPELIPSPSDRFRSVGAWYMNTARVLK